MLESLFNKVAGLRAPTKVFSCEICENFKNTFFYRIRPVVAHVTISSSLMNQHIAQLLKSVAVTLSTWTELQ